jgi:hypothetical protein
MIAMASQQGPWPKCLGMTGQECATYVVSSTTRDSLDVMIVVDGTIVTSDFRKDRVRIFVNEEGIVEIVPGRG